MIAIRIGIPLVVLGLGSVVLRLIDYHFTVLAWADPYQPYLGYGLAGGGLLLIVIGVLTSRASSKEPAAQYPQQQNGYAPQQNGYPAQQNGYPPQQNFAPRQDVAPQQNFFNAPQQYGPPQGYPPAPQGPQYGQPPYGAPGGQPPAFGPQGGQQFGPRR